MMPMSQCERLLGCIYTERKGTRKQNMSFIFVISQYEKLMVLVLVIDSVNAVFPSLFAAIL